MRVSVYSRKAIESIIADGKFPENTAVISFCDPELKHIDKDYSRVDYSSACDDVFYCEVDDLTSIICRKRVIPMTASFPKLRSWLSI